MNEKFTEPRVYNPKDPRRHLDVHATVSADPEPATKDDTEKAQLDLLDPRFVEEVAKVLAFGERKYGPANYRRGNGLSLSRMVNAIKRHTLRIEMGEDLDMETGRHHLAHIAATAMMMFSIQTRIEDHHDDRPFSENKTCKTTGPI